MLIIPAFLLIAGCYAFSSDEDESGKDAFTGQVLDDQTNNPVPGAFIRILPFDLLFEADLEGLFSFIVAEDIDPLTPETPVVNAIVIKTEVPNGTLEIVLGSGGVPFSRTRGIRTIELPDGRYQFEHGDSNPVEIR